MLFEILVCCKAFYFIGLIKEINSSFDMFILFLINYEIITRIGIYFTCHTHIFLIYIASVLRDKFSYSRIYIYKKRV